MNFPADVHNAKRDIAYAELCQATYSVPGLGDHFACHAGIVDGLYTVCFRGTKSWQEWIADAVAFPLWPIRTFKDAELGPIHAGFLLGAQKLRAQVAADVAGRPFALCGHSLGGALATVLGAFLTASGSPPVEIVTFGAPRAGMDPLVAVLQRVAIRQYHYGHDPVTHIPTNPPFVHARSPLLQLGRTLQFSFADHHICNYIQALTELSHAAETRPSAGHSLQPA